jgi:hypothetical protein
VDEPVSDLSEGDLRALEAALLGASGDELAYWPGRWLPLDLKPWYYRSE